MPAIYFSFEVEPGDTIEIKMQKLYLGMISCGEQAYTLGAAIAENRKQLSALDEQVKKIVHDFYEVRKELPGFCPKCGCRASSGICQNYGCN